MRRHEFLHELHQVYRPRTYLEIGVNDGRSLRLSRAATIAVDPAFKVVQELNCNLQLVRATSDDFFAREDPMAHFRGCPVDMAFIDGMHLFEYVLRDFINTERYADWSSVIVFDDQLPRNVDEAARDRHTGAWTGDVYKIIPVLQRYRPDLQLAVMNTRPTGVMVVFGADPSNTVLEDHYDEIMDTFLLKDPQQVPEQLLTRTCAMEPEVLLSAPFWSNLVAARDAGQAGGGGAASYGREQLRADVARLLADTPRPTLVDWVPDPRAGRDTEYDSSVAVGEQRMLALARQRAAAARQTRAGVPSGTAACDVRGGRGGASRPSHADEASGGDSQTLRKLVRRAPFLRKIPGAPGLVRRLR
ncbi:MAG TPA: class I SAM-dependent methyltransferase [Actinopolymorphaceae bacterium]